MDVESGDRDLYPLKEGELVVKGRQVMLGYWRFIDETNLVLKNGWLFTGDIATLDKDGYFHIVDRKKT